MHFALFMFFTLLAITNTAVASKSSQKVDMEYYLSASGLFQGDGTDWNPPDPYCVVKIRDASASFKGWVLQGQTDYDSGTINPTWSKKWTVDWTTLQSKEIKFEVWDKDVAIHDSLGEYKTAVSELVTANHYVVSSAFTTIDGRLTGGDHVTGKIHIRSRITSMKETRSASSSNYFNNISVLYKFSVVLSSLSFVLQI